ncbi:MAG: hypothetical protein HY699_09540 [Deltaproteobacteria bacterium]|nr:hypothetical protein [Deltaproteobacteria bacterium]
MKTYRQLRTTRSITKTAGRAWRTIAACTLALAASAGPALAECDTSICSGDPCTITGTHYIDCLCDLNFGSKTVTIAPSATLRADGCCFSIEAANLIVSGTLRARAGCITVTTTGYVTTNIVSNSAGTIDVSDGGSADITAGGAVTLNGRNVDADNSAGYAGDIAIIGSSVSGTSAVHADGGDGGDGGNLDISSTTGAVSLTGNVTTNGGGSYGWGGYITVDSADALTVGTSTRRMQAKGASGGDGGTIDLTAAGSAAINGDINANGAGTDGGYGGDISIDAAYFSCATVSAITATGGSGGGDGGYIDITATCGASVDCDMDVGGQGEMAWGGDITIDAGAGSGCTALVTANSRLEADSSGTDASDGTVEVSGCSVTHSGVFDTRNTNLDSGTNIVRYRNNFTANAGSSMLADDDGGNLIYCRCVDTTPADGVCDTPAACVNSPTLNGTVNPAATIIPTAMAACS